MKRLSSTCLFKLVKVNENKSTQYKFNPFPYWETLLMKKEYLSQTWLRGSLGYWWALEMCNYMGTFCLLTQLNPPFSLVYCMFFIIFMLIEWIGLVIMSWSLMCALCRFLVNFGQSQRINENLAANIWGKREDL